MEVVSIVATAAARPVRMRMALHRCGWCSYELGVASGPRGASQASQFHAKGLAAPGTARPRRRRSRRAHHRPSPHMYASSPPPRCPRVQGLATPWLCPVSLTGTLHCFGMKNSKTRQRQTHSFELRNPARCSWPSSWRVVGLTKSQPFCSGNVCSPSLPRTDNGYWRPNGYG